MINSLSFPAYQQGSDLDFSRLAQLPQVYRQTQQDAWTLANIDRLRAAQELTPAMKEYSPARRQGFNGTFMDFRRLRSVQADTEPSLILARP